MTDVEQLVVGWGEELEMSEDAINLAREYATSAEFEYPVNRTIRATAAGSLYLAGLIANDKRTQDAVSDATGVNTHTIRDAYREILKYEDRNAHAAINKEPTVEDDSGWSVPSIPGSLKTAVSFALTFSAVVVFVGFVVPHLGMAETVDPNGFGASVPLWQPVALTAGLVIVTALCAASLVSGWPLPGSIGMGGRNR